MKNGKRKIPDILILTALVISIIYLILNDCSSIIHWKISWKNILVITGLFLDAFFSIDFAVRIYRSSRSEGLLFYIRNENGWADLISSVFPLLLDSIPSFLVILSAGSGATNVWGLFYSLKMLRIADTLRLFRIVKIFTLINPTGSAMAGHHISVINTIAVSAIISVYFIFSLNPGNTNNKLLKERSIAYADLIDGLKRISDMNGIGYREISESMLLSDKKILKIIYGNGTVIEKFPDDFFRKEYTQEDYIQVAGRACTVYVSVKDIGRISAIGHIKVLMIIIFTGMSILMIYSRHFARNISDIARILNQGFRKKDYNLLVKIPEKYSEHEIFRLSKFYNDAYLPAKMKKIMDREAGRGILK